MKNGSCTTGCGSVWLECTAGGREVAGSNPVTPSFIIWWVWHSWLARQIVALEVVGSNPTIHPFLWVTSSVGRALDF